MKQKIVIKLTTVGSDDKSRRKALKAAVCQAGVDSAALEGLEKNEIVVIGDGVDAVELISCLRKKVRYAELVTVNPIDEKKDDAGGDKTKTTENKDQATVQPPLIFTSYPYHQPYLPPYYERAVMYNEPSCTIM